MANHANSTNPSEIDRRVVLGGLAAVSLTAPALSSAQALEQEHPDAALLLLGERLKAAHAKTSLLVIEADRVQTPEADKACEDAMDVEHKIVKQIEGVVPHTVHGLRVKAQAVEWCHSWESIELNDQQTTDIRLAQQIIRALLTH